VSQNISSLTKIYAYDVVRCAPFLTVFIHANSRSMFKERMEGMGTCFWSSLLFSPLASMA